MARASANIEDIQDRTPIYLAAERGHTHVVDYLADKFKVKPKLWLYLTFRYIFFSIQGIGLYEG